MQHVEQNGLLVVAEASWVVAAMLPKLAAAVEGFTPKRLTLLLEEMGAMDLDLAAVVAVALSVE